MGYGFSLAEADEADRVAEFPAGYEQDRVQERLKARSGRMESEDEDGGASGAADGEL
jgi:hypothetical protein